MNRVIGSLEAILDYGFSPRKLRTRTLQRKENVQYEIDDLELLGVLESGAFGKVRVAKAKQSGKCYALKMKGKFFIVENEQQVDVVNDLRT